MKNIDCFSYKPVSGHSNNIHALAWLNPKRLLLTRYVGYNPLLSLSAFASTRLGARALAEEVQKSWALRRAV